MGEIENFIQQQKLNKQEEEAAREEEGEQSQESENEQDEEPKNERSRKDEAERTAAAALVQGKRSVTTRSGGYNLRGAN